jgi:hypothetical protein
MRRARPRWRIRGGIAAVVTVQRTMLSPKERGHRCVYFGWRCGRRPLAPVTVTHAGGWPAAVPAFWGERSRSSERAQLAAANGESRWGLLRREIERVTFWGERASVAVRTGVSFRGKKWVHPIGSPPKETHTNKHASPVQKLSVTYFIARYQYVSD